MLKVTLIKKTRINTIIISRLAFEAMKRDLEEEGYKVVINCKHSNNKSH